jgi:excisionase family DNA binding protein
VTVPEAARILSIGRTALYQLIWNGDLTPVHIGRSVRFPIDELHDFIERRIASEVERAGP